MFYKYQSIWGWSDLPAHFQPRRTKLSVPQRKKSGPGHTLWAQGTWWSWGALTPQEAGPLVCCLGWASTTSHAVLWELKPQPLVQQIQLLPKGLCPRRPPPSPTTPQGTWWSRALMFVGKSQSNLEKQCHRLSNCRGNVCSEPGCWFRTSNFCCSVRPVPPAPMTRCPDLASLP